MGADENLEVARRWFAAMAEGNQNVELWHPECLIENAEGWVIETTYSGRDGARRWWNDLAEAFTDLRVFLDDAVPIDSERVLTTQHFKGRFRTTGIDFHGPWASILTFRDGLVIRATGFMTERQARRAAGLGVEATGEA